MKIQIAKRFDLNKPASQADMGLIHFADALSLLLSWTTAAGALWLRHPLREQEVVGSILLCDKPKSLKLVVIALRLDNGVRIMDWLTHSHTTTPFDAPGKQAF